MLQNILPQTTYLAFVLRGEKSIPEIYFNEELKSILVRSRVWTEMLLRTLIMLLSLTLSGRMTEMFISGIPSLLTDSAVQMIISLWVLLSSVLATSPA